MATFQDLEQWVRDNFGDFDWEYDDFFDLNGHHKKDDDVIVTVPHKGEHMFITVNNVKFLGVSTSGFRQLIHDHFATARRSWEEEEQSKLEKAQAKALTFLESL